MPTAVNPTSSDERIYAPPPDTSLTHPNHSLAGKEKEYGKFKNDNLRDLWILVPALIGLFLLVYLLYHIFKHIHQKRIQREDERRFLNSVGIWPENFGRFSFEIEMENFGFPGGGIGGRANRRTNREDPEEEAARERERAERIVTWRGEVGDGGGGGEEGNAEDPRSGEASGSGNGGDRERDREREVSPRGTRWVEV